MKNFFKGKVATAIIILATFILAGVAIFTAIRLYQLRNQAVAPNVPSSQPHAQVVCPQDAKVCPDGSSVGRTGPNCEFPACPVSTCSLSFTLTPQTASPTPTETPTGTPTATPTGTPTPTPTATPGPSATPNACGGTCGSNFNCQSNFVCYNGFCRNPSCTSSTNCVCSGTAAPSTPAPTLPQSGTDWPTIATGFVGILVILGSLILAL